MPNQQINNEKREKIIFHLSDHSASEISKVLGFKRTSVYVVIKKYKQNSETKRQLKGGIRRESLSEDDKNAIKTWIDENSSITLNELKDKCLIKNLSKQIDPQ